MNGGWRRGGEELDPPHPATYRADLSSRLARPDWITINRKDRYAGEIFIEFTYFIAVSIASSRRPAFAPACLSTDLLPPRSLPSSQGCSSPAETAETSPRWISLRWARSI